MLNSQQTSHILTSNANYRVSIELKKMMISSNANLFHITGSLWGESTSQQEWIPLLKASDAEFAVFFDLRLNKRLSKQARRQWFEMPFHSLWCHCNETILYGDYNIISWWNSWVGAVKLSMTFFIAWWNTYIHFLIWHLIFIITQMKVWFIYVYSHYNI